MTDEAVTKDKDGARRNDRGVAAVLALVALVVVIAVAGPRVQRRYYGTTPQQLMDEPLPRDEAQVDRELHLTSVDRIQSQATVRLRSRVSDPYVKAIYTFGPLSGMPSELRLVPEGKHLGRGARVRAALARHVRLKDDAFSWGAIHVEVNPSTGEVWFKVQLSAGVSATARQVDAARQLVLSAAFGLPTHMTDREIADALGAGYPTADLAKLDPATTLDGAEAALRKLFPAMVRASEASFRVPLDHPLLHAVRLDWQDEPKGRLAHVEALVARSYASVRVPLEQCLEKHLGPPKVETNDEGSKDYVFVKGSLSLRLGAATMRFLPREEPIASGLDVLVRALDACRDSK